ncbi:MAG: NAD(P)-dependent oxidoreductase, partial [Sulfurospirillaceae bacterium]|nr:NAD(P)-dependent oxidoreductase [Sulfurospirillaceae bacterium]
MKIAVTGATGFIARHLLPILKKDHEVIAIARFQESRVRVPWLDGIEKVALDVTNSEGDVFSLLGKPDKLIHLAWGGLPNYKSLNHLTEGVMQLLFLKNAIEGGLQDLTVTGTCFEYGMRDGKLSENDITLPANPYGFAKDSLRKALEFLTIEKKFVFRWARLFYMYGEGQSHNS